MVHRIISLPKESFFLFGPRQTGKSTLIKSLYTKNVWAVDLLLTDNFLRYSKEPASFGKEALAAVKSGKVKTIFIDEIQRVPILLNEIQHLMQESKCQFIMTGSSARKLRRGGANLLGGRAVERFLYPFIYTEIKDRFDLDEVLLFGTLPSLLDKNKEEKIDILSAYVNTYLKEEIQSEGIVRNLGGFSRFLDIAASQIGDPVNFSSISRECYVSTKTVQSYYEILEDTLIGFRLNPWRKSIRKRLSAQPKYYLFDTGVTNAILKRLRSSLDPAIKGDLFEQWILSETIAAIRYSKSEATPYFWRTNHGAEVDLLIEKHGKIKAAIEIKCTSNVTGPHLSGLRAFRQEHPGVESFIVSRVPRLYELEGVQILPWKAYLQKLRSII